ncbi:uncharacterized protein N7483_003949 [Penicillium malachiteum]|uniref:uncharacterized protein n=1 Tax=Penicillium malachiteum TaxID=1324776 RepID=UPI002548CEF1|nr:uncharacterized protein N7483_003949 [Penicillium malachiteum]KAJ5729441.1 hypothetical protein N7483_003949 [Penicillium malachiteum]
MASPGLERRDDQNIFSELDDPERRAIVTELLRDIPTMRLVSRHGFWKMWFHDVPQMKKALSYMKPRLQWDVGCPWKKREELEQGPEYPTTHISYTHCHEHDALGLRAPIQADKWFLQASELSITSSQRIAMERDESQCILTKNNSNPVLPTHIFPSRSQQIKRGHINNQYKYIWLRLEDEFGGKRVQRWRNSIMDRIVLCQKILGDLEDIDNVDYADQPDNIITLGKEVWRFWKDDLCVFRPVSLSEDKKSMELAFHWLPLPKEGTHHSQLDPIKLRCHPYPDRRMGYDEGPGNGIHLYHAETKQMIRSGYIFTIHTENPETHPLPSMELLDMQWMLKRSSRFQGDLVEWRQWPVKQEYYEKVYEKVKPYCWLYRGKLWSYRHCTWMYKEDLEVEEDDEENKANNYLAKEHYLSKHQDEDGDEDEDDYEWSHERNPYFEFTFHQMDVTDDEEDLDDNSEDEEDMKFDNFKQENAERAALSYPHHSVSRLAGHVTLPRRKSLSKRKIQERKGRYARQKIENEVHEAEETGGSYNRGFQPSEKMELLEREDGKPQLEENDIDEDRSKGCKAQALCGALQISLSFRS